MEDVEPYEGEFLRYMVRSKSRPGHTWLVDLSSYDFNGFCPCEAFTFRCGPELARGAKPSNKLRCSHIRSARSFFLDEILPRLAPALGEQVKQRAQPDGGPAQLRIRRALVEITKGQDTKAQKLGALMFIREIVTAALEHVENEP